MFSVIAEGCHPTDVEKVCFGPNKTYNLPDVHHLNLFFPSFYPNSVHFSIISP
jgi:hypothetical protein